MRLLHCIVLYIELFISYKEHFHREGLTLNLAHLVLTFQRISLQSQFFYPSIFDLQILKSDLDYQTVHII